MHENAHVSAETSRPGLLAKAIGVAGFLLHFALLPMIMTSGLVAPGWAIMVIVAGWAVLLMIGVGIWRTRPSLIILIPVLGAAWWLGALAFGGTFLGWQA